MSDVDVEEQPEGEDLEGAEQEEREEPEPEAEAIQEPSEKELVDSLILSLGPVYGCGRIRICEGLERWALHALSDDLYWMKKNFEGGSPPADAEQAEGEGDDGDAPPPASAPQQGINLPMVLEKTDDGWDAKLYVEKQEDVPGEPEAEAEAGGGGEEEAEEGEDQEEPAEGVGEQPEEVAPLQIRCDLLSLVVAQSAQCAAHFMVDTATSLDAVVDFCLSTLSRDTCDYNDAFLAAVGAARALNPEREFRVSFVGFFGRPFSADPPEKENACVDTTKYLEDRIMREWWDAGLSVRGLPPPHQVCRPHDVWLLKRLVELCSDATLAQLSSAPEGEEADADTEAGEEDGPAVLPGFVVKLLQNLRTNQVGACPKELHVTCSDPEICGKYTKRGKEGGKPRYWMGDPVQGSGSYYLFYTPNYGWRIKRDDDVLYVCRGMVSHDLPIKVQRWTHALPPRETIDIYLTPGALASVVPKLSSLERQKTDPLISTAFTERSIVPRHLQLRYSDLLLFVLMTEYHNGAAVAFEKLLKFKLSRPRALTDPVGWPHLLYMSLPHAPAEAVMQVIASAREFLRPLGLVPVQDFIAQVVPQLSDDVLRHLASHCYDTILSQSARGQVEGQAFVKRCAQQQQHYKAAEDALQEQEKAPDMLQHLANAHSLSYDDTFLHKAVVANNKKAMVYFLDTCRVPPQVREAVYMEPQPLVRFVIEQKRVELLEALVQRGHDLSLVWDGALISGLQYVVQNFAEADANRILALWKKAENERTSDPQKGFGLLRPVVVNSATVQ